MDVFSPAAGIIFVVLFIFALRCMAHKRIPGLYDPENPRPTTGYVTARQIYERYRADRSLTIQRGAQEPELVEAVGRVRDISAGQNGYLIDMYRLTRGPAAIEAIAEKPVPDALVRLFDGARQGDLMIVRGLGAYKSGTLTVRDVIKVNGVIARAPKGDES